MQVKHVRRPGAQLEELDLDHETKHQNSKSQGGARQEPRHPPARCPETRQRKEPAKQQQEDDEDHEAHEAHETHEAHEAHEDDIYDESLQMFF